MDLSQVTCRQAQWTYREKEQTLSNASSQATHQSTQKLSPPSAFLLQSLSVCMHLMWLLLTAGSNCGHLSPPYSTWAITHTHFSWQAQSCLHFALFNTHYLLQGCIQSLAARSQSLPDHLYDLQGVCCAYVCVFLLHFDLVLLACGGESDRKIYCVSFFSV